ncbi:MAG: polysaccharide pyruvyl transferase family protein [Empedobacter falsenii]
MNLIYFKADIGNFGDDLNLFLWEKLLGDFNDFDNNIDFVGIGSILDNRILKNKNHKKVVFGSGIRDIDFRTSLEDNLEIQFVRGPISSRLINDAKYITDAAYCLRLLNEFELNKEKKYQYSYIPYFRNYYNFNWGLFSKITGINVINPTSDIKEVIKNINESELIFTSAMHGAILADIYRVPWKRVRFNKTGYESNFTSELKWQDWLRTIDLSNHQSIDLDFNLNNRFNKITEIVKIYKITKKLKSNHFSLSMDSKISEIDEKLYDEVNLFVNKYKK